MADSQTAHGDTPTEAVEGAERIRTAVPAPGADSLYDNRAALVAHLAARDGDCCFYCDEPQVGYHVDHVTARAHGGTDDPANRVLACAPCNLAKRTHPAWLFALYLGAGLAIPRVLPAPRLHVDPDAWARGDWVDDLLVRSAALRAVAA